MKWILEVDEEGVITLPEELLEVTGLVEGDELQWISCDDGSYKLRKLDNT